MIFSHCFIQTLPIRLHICTSLNLCIYIFNAGEIIYFFYSFAYFSYDVFLNIYSLIISFFLMKFYKTSFKIHNSDNKI